LGAEVTCVEFNAAIGAGADGEIAYGALAICVLLTSPHHSLSWSSKTFQRSLQKQGMKFMVESKVTSVDKVGEKSYKVNIENVKTGEKTALESDVVLVAVGRRPYTKELGLESIGVKVNNRGFVEVDHSRRTNVPGVWAIGDVIPGPMLAHKAEEEGIAVVEEIATPGVGHVNYDVIPSVIYTHPEVSWVGKTEEQLKAANVQYKVGKFPFVANSRAKTNGASANY